MAPKMAASQSFQISTVQTFVTFLFSGCVRLHDLVRAYISDSLPLIRIE